MRFLVVHSVSLEAGKVKGKPEKHRRFFSLLLLILVSITLRGSFSVSVAQPPYPNNGKTFVDAPFSVASPFRSPLSPDGTIGDRTGGNFELKGLRMTHAANGQPRSAPEYRPDQANASTGCSDGWYDGPPANGISGGVGAIAVDGAGNVYAGGSFRVAGSSIVNNIAKWDGSTWSALDSGTNGYVSSIAVSGTDVYVGGTFTTAGGVAANYVAKWNGSSWSPVGSGPEHPVNDLKVSGSNIYVAGGAWDQGTQTAEGAVSVWDGTGWSNFGPTFDYTVTSLAVSGTDVYAVGGDRIVKWNGSGWSDIGSGFNAYVQVLAVSGSDVYAAGRRPTGNGVQIAVVARWNGSGWTELGSGMANNGPVSYASIYSMAVAGTDVYVAGYFATAGGIPSNGVAKWNGSSWSAVGSWGGTVNTVTVSGADVYFGGWQFFSPGGVLRADGIAKWNGSNWSGFGSGIYSSPSVLKASGTDVYGAGYFTTDGGNTVNRVAKWNGAGWTPLGSWPSGPADGIARFEAVAVSGSDVYVSGYWQNADYQFLSGFVFRWNGSSWSELGSWPNRAVAALGVSGTDVYAGGYTLPTVLGFVSKWNGSTWSEIGPTMNGPVVGLAVSGTDVYAGGRFPTTEGTGTSYVAKWTGSSWSFLGGSPIEPYLRPSAPNAPADWFHGVDEMVISGADIYVASGWWDDYGQGAGFVSKWNGSNWSELPRMCCSPVYAIAASSTDVYAGGIFTAAGGTLVNNIARWNGFNWAALGAGVDNAVTAVAVSGSDVFVGGYFSTAGCHVSAGFARYSSAPVSEVSVSGRVTTSGGRGIGNARVTITDPSGVVQTTITSAFGYFRFDNVISGQSYTVNVRSKRYSFEPRTIQVSAELINVNFVPQ